MSSLSVYCADAGITWGLEMIERVKEFPSLTIIRHPLVQHKLTILRDRKRQTKIFKELVDEIAMLMAYEATIELTLEPMRC